MEYDSNIGGCCGEIMVDRNQRSWRAPVVMSQVTGERGEGRCAAALPSCRLSHRSRQHFEYTMAK